MDKLYRVSCVGEMVMAHVNGTLYWNVFFIFAVCSDSISRNVLENFNPYPANVENMVSS